MAKKMSAADQRKAAKQFAENWKDRGYEKGEGQIFWTTLLQRVFGVDEIEDYIQFEKRVGTHFADAYIPSASVLIEQKSIDKNLDDKIHDEGGKKMTAFEQAKFYVADLPRKEHPRWIIVSNFKEIRIHNMDTPLAKPEVIYLERLDKDYQMLQFLVDPEVERVKHEEDVSFKAGELIGELYKTLLNRYNSTGPKELHSLNVLCVRLVFCLYAENSDVFPRYGMFHDYLEKFRPEQMRGALIDLFKILDQNEEVRDEYLSDDLAEFPYVNGGLFSDDSVIIPRFDEEIRTLLIERCSEDLNWSSISPTIFGAIFESTLNPETRDVGGMHYTSIENIHKVIDPLFLDDLKNEFEDIRRIRDRKKRKAALKEFQEKLGAGRYLDPACGSGNFLTETYLSLRRLENEVLYAGLDSQSQTMLEDGRIIKVSLAQFGGIEINDFAVTVAKTALWIAESQMMAETERIVNRSLNFLPLKNEMNIIEGNALRMEWSDVLGKDKPMYIIGNPPFSGARLMDKAQKKDVTMIFDGWKNAGNLDYVACWFKKAADFISGTNIRCALVSTNSITQGESVAVLWKPLMRDYPGFHIDFAHRSFRWDSESASMAHVHCVIVGFSSSKNDGPLKLYTDGRPVTAKNINAYLVDAENVFVESRSEPLCDVPRIGIGNQPIDGGNYLFTEEEMNLFLEKEPSAENYFRRWYGAKELINNKPRWCLWLGDCTPAELRRMPQCMKRVEAVKEFRLASKREGTRKLANKPTRFLVENMPEDNYIVIPETSSERRRYVPMGFMSSDVLCSNLLFIVPDATMYHFGILTSSVHMAWMKAVCGRLETRFRYSKDIVYNDFPWPASTEAQKKKIEATAQSILDVRASYPDSNLAVLYDELTMPEDLRKAHEANDKAVMAAYGFSRGMSEDTIVAELMKLYSSLVSPIQ